MVDNSHGKLNLWSRCTHTRGESARSIKRVEWVTILNNNARDGERHSDHIAGATSGPFMSSCHPGSLLDAIVRLARGNSMNNTRVSDAEGRSSHTFEIPILHSIDESE